MNIEFRPFKGTWDWGFVRLHTTILRVEDTTGIMAIDTDTNTTVGAAIADNFTQTSCQCHLIVLGTMLLRHEFLEACADYFFNLQGMNTLYGWVPADNEKAIKVNGHMGWQTKAVFENGYKQGVDYLLMELKKADCKYLNIEHSEVA
jgi:hypothetical protein